MFNVGGGEVIVIFLVALIVLGPDKLPEAVRKLGQIIGEIRTVSNSFQAEMRTAMFEQEAEDRARQTSSETQTPPSGSEDEAEQNESDRLNPGDTDLYDPDLFDPDLDDLDLDGYHPGSHDHDSGTSE